MGGDVGDGEHRVRCWGFLRFDLLSPPPGKAVGVDSLPCLEVFDICWFLK